MSSHYTVPGLSDRQGAEVAAMLQKQLSRYNDLHLTLKHAHWNVVGSNFIGVHQMIDSHVALVRGYADAPHTSNFGRCSSAIRCNSS